MSESIQFSKSATRETIYLEVLPQIETLLKGEPDLVANLANVSAILKETFGFFWIGFYWVRGDELVLGPFQGTLACSRIKKGRGVCGEAWETARTVVVPDVNQFPGHIACSSLSRSEIVVPIVHKNQVVGILDIDSDKLNEFDKTDVRFLEEIAATIVLHCLEV
jgi:L-methionine (R)-S-oxide reductase